MADGAAWVTREKWTPESIKAEIAFVLTARPENGSIGAGGWSEINNWSVVATMMFKSGKRGRIFLDGLHVSYEDPEGRYWLYRVTGSRPWK
jgi:hypothetical protein